MNNLAVSECVCWTYGWNDGQKRQGMVWSGEREREREREEREREREREPETRREEYREKEDEGRTPFRQVGASMVSSRARI